MPHAAGDHVAIVRGPNRGKNGTFVRNVGVTSCHVVLKGKVQEQKFWLTSVAAAMVVPVPPFPLSQLPLRFVLRIALVWKGLRKGLYEMSRMSKFRAS
jgi:hypothetical protein